MQSALTRATVLKAQLHRLPRGVINTRSFSTAPAFPGIRADSGFTTTLEFQSEAKKFPVYRRLDEEGNLIGGETLPVSEETLRQWWEQMVRLSVYDSVLYEIQRQGRISFYMQNSGEEGLQIASAAALEMEDMVWPQYREAGVFMYRGFTVQNMVDQCMGTKDDVGKGRQMPVHYCYPEKNIQAVTSPIATQVIQAAGAGYAFTLDAETGGSSRVSVAYFGEGATSEGDTSVAFNFAAVRNSHTLFICRNNGYAISTPITDQMVSDGVAVRGPAFGMAASRVDGNDVIAVYEAVKASREKIVSEHTPVLLELMTYRRGHHSTSDDSTRYRPKDELGSWSRPGVDPISRLGKLLQKRNVVEDIEALEKEVREAAKSEVIDAIKIAEKKKRASVQNLFEDVYAELPWHLKEQRDYLLSHVEKNKHKYHLDQFEQE